MIIRNSFYNTFVYLAIIQVSTCKTPQAKGQHKEHNVAHSSRHIWKKIQKISAFFSSTLLYFLIILFKKELKAPQFFKISFILFVFDWFLCHRWILQGLQWVSIEFLVCSTRFLVSSGGFLLWFLAIKRVIKCLCVFKLDCKSFLSAFGLKSCKYCLRRRQ